MPETFEEVRHFQKASERTEEILKEIVEGTPKFKEAEAEQLPRKFYCSLQCLQRSVEGGVPVVDNGKTWKWAYIDEDRDEEAVCARCGEALVGGQQGIVYDPDGKGI